MDQKADGRFGRRLVAQGTKGSTTQPLGENHFWPAVGTVQGSGGLDLASCDTDRQSVWGFTIFEYLQLFVVSSRLLHSVSVSASD